MAFLAGMGGVHLAAGLRWISEGRGGFLAAFVLSRPPRLRMAAGGGWGPFIDGGATWRIWTSVLVHVDALHLGMNAVAIAVLGRMLEPLFGAWRFAAIAWAGGVAGALASHGVGNLQSDGASGAGFALMGAGLVTGLRHRRALPAEDARFLGPVLGAFIALNLALSVVLPFIDLTAHAGGLAAGVLLGIWPGTRRTAALDAADRAWVLLSVAICGWGWWRVFGPR